MTQIISFANGAAHLNWLDLVQALKDGHQRPKAQTKDMFLYRGADTVLTRSAWIDGMGMFTKSATVFPDNPIKGKPMIGGGALLFDDADGDLTAVIDFHLITKWENRRRQPSGRAAACPRHGARYFDRRGGHCWRITGGGIPCGVSQGDIDPLEPKPCQGPRPGAAKGCGGG